MTAGFGLLGAETLVAQASNGGTSNNGNGNGNGHGRPTPTPAPTAGPGTTPAPVPTASPTTTPGYFTDNNWQSWVNATCTADHCTQNSQTQKTYACTFTGGNGTCTARFGSLSSYTCKQGSPNGAVSWFCSVIVGASAPAPTAAPTPAPAPTPTAAPTGSSTPVAGGGSSGGGHSGGGSSGGGNSTSSSGGSGSATNQTSTTTAGSGTMSQSFDGATTAFVPGQPVLWSSGSTVVAPLASGAEVSTVGAQSMTAQRVAPLDALTALGGLRFGSGLQLWPVLLLLDVMVAVGIARVLRRPWMLAPAEQPA